MADVWSLGVTLYAMLAAQLPFEGETNEKRKANIMNCKYNHQPSFSIKAQKLLSSIFVDAKHRVHLWELKASEFSLTYQTVVPHFIDFHHENIVLEDEVMDILDKDYHIDRQKVAESVKYCRLDKYHAMYYLTLKNEKHFHRHTQNDHLDEFKKQRKGSLVKLDPISRTPSLSKKKVNTHHESRDERIMSLKTSRVIKSKELTIKTRQTIDPSQARLRKNSPDSPRRLIDCLAAYKPF